MNRIYFNIKNTSTIHVFALCALLNLFSCKPQNGNSSKPIFDNAENIIIADTITYNFDLKVIDSTDYWQIESLKNLKRDLLVNYLFTEFYKGAFAAYSFPDNETLTFEDVKRIEKEDFFSRDKISMIQFKERWFINKQGALVKEPISYTLGIETYSKQNTFLGYKPLLTLKPKI
ncbi:MAG TPA: hypothetical protein PLA24_07995 [Tenuifilaceae bacterium]|nr:hypothetical protein [Tenuifilaceae bacterium]